MLCINAGVFWSFFSISVGIDIFVFFDILGFFVIVGRVGLWYGYGFGYSGGIV